MDGKKLRQQRAAAGIPGALLRRRAQLHRSRLSDIERGHVEPTADETRRIRRALDQLISARRKVTEVAAEVGWPL